MKSSSTSRRSRLPVGLAVGVVVALLVLAIAAFDVYRDLAQQRQKRIELEEQIQRAEERIRELEERIERMRSDPETLEQLVREELGLVRPEDVIVVFPEPEGPRGEGAPGEAPGTTAPPPDS